MTKPKLSFWQIWNLSFGFLGVQIGYSLQNSNTSSIFESLGADVSHLSYFWLAAPLAGMIVQPIVGLFSDGTWTRWGRRIPYILGGSLISALALVLMPNCPKLLAFAPLAMGAFILLFMDLSFNVTMQPFRALVADMLDDSQKTQGYVVQTFSPTPTMPGARSCCSRCSSPRSRHGNIRPGSSPATTTSPRRTPNR